MRDAKARGGVAQADALLIHHTPSLREDAKTMPEGVAAAHTAGESAGLDYSRHGEERRESDIIKWRENSYVATVQSVKNI
jgi:hypothetical protein